MSDDRFTRESGEDDEPYVPTQPRRKPQQQSWFEDVKPRTVSADEIEEFLVKYCQKMGIPRHERGKQLRGGRR